MTWSHRWTCINSEADGRRELLLFVPRGIALRGCGGDKRLSAAWMEPLHNIICNNLGEHTLESKTNWLLTHKQKWRNLISLSTIFPPKTSKKRWKLTLEDNGMAIVFLRFILFLCRHKGVSTQTPNLLCSCSFWQMSQEASMDNREQGNADKFDHIVSTQSTVLSQPI